MSAVDAAALVLTRAFFARPAPTVARELIGKVLCRRDEQLAARIVEVEAYTQDDPACHAYRGQTVRNAPLFGPAGHAYVYRSYGMHWCFNVSSGAVGVGQGCLIRAAEPLHGLDVMRRRRPVRHDVDLLRGPAKLCQALDITGALSGVDLCEGEGRDAVAQRQRAGGRGSQGEGERQRAGGRGSQGEGEAPLQLYDDGTRPPVAEGPRVGVSQAADVPWRFFVPDSPWVSVYRRSPRAPKA